MTRVIVDNSTGADGAFAAQMARELRGGGFEVEVRDPVSTSSYDTFVHVVADGVSVRVMEDDIDRGVLGELAALVREAERRRPIERKRSRPVPVYRGETRRVLRWVDVYDADA